MKRTLKIALPILVLSVAVVLARGMILSRPEPETRNLEVPLPLVRVQTIELEDLRLTVESQGTVRPRTESALVAEVAGNVIEVSDRFAAGTFFDRGDLLVRIDPHDYRQAVTRAQAQVARARLRLAQEEAEADVARREWNDLGLGEPTDLTLRVPQVADARAAVDAAIADLEQARRNLERTEIRAPYTGRVRAKEVDRGQFVNRGTPVATIYAVDAAEIRLPLQDADLAYLELPMGYQGRSNPSGPAAGPEVILRTEFAGKMHEWRGRIVRIEGEIDPQSRMVHTVARVSNPYARGKDPSRPPLAAGLFVDAEILGILATGVAVIPRSAVRGDGRVLVVDGEDRLHFRDVEILRTTRDEAIVASGVESGDRLCLSGLAAVTEGMRVRVLPEETASAGGAG